MQQRGFESYSAVRGGTTDEQKQLPFVLTNEFRELWETANQRYVSWDDLDQFALPKGATKEQIWKTLTALRRHAGVLLPFRPFVSQSDGKMTWITPPHDMEQALVLLKTQGSSQTIEYQTYQALHESRKLSIILNEFVTTLAIDGYKVDFHEGLTGYLTQRTPSTAEDQALNTLIKTFFRAPTVLDEPITPQYLDQLNSAFQADTPSEASSIMLPQIEKARDRYLNQDYYTPEITKQTICDILNDQTLNPIIAELQAIYFFVGFRPYEHFNTSTALLLRRVYYERRNLGLLANMAIFTALSKWQHKAYNLDIPSHEHTLNPHDCGEGFDATEFTYCNILIYANELRLLQRKIAATQANITTACERIEASPLLNERQKAIVSKMIDNPFFTITIEQAAQNCRVSYSSARTDLLGLVRQGFLVLDCPDMANQAQVFRVGPNTIALLSTVNPRLFDPRINTNPDS